MRQIVLINVMGLFSILLTNSVHYDSITEWSARGGYVGAAVILSIISLTWGNKKKPLDN